MKKAITVLSLFIIFGITEHSQAQLVKGDRIISGTFNISTSSSSSTVGNSVINGPKSTNVNLAVDGMQIVSSQTGPGALGLGVRLSFLNNILTEEDEGVTVTQSVPMFEIAPFVRSYFTNTSKLGLFAEGMLGLGFGKEKVEQKSTSGTTAEEVNTSGFRVTARPGLSYFVTQKIGLEFLFGSIGYQSTTTKYSSDSKNTESDFGISFDLSTVQVGVSLKI